MQYKLISQTAPWSSEVAAGPGLPPTYSSGVGNLRNLSVVPAGLTKSNVPKKRRGQGLSPVLCVPPGAVKPINDWNYSVTEELYPYGTSSAKDRTPTKWWWYKTVTGPVQASLAGSSPLPGWERTDNYNRALTSLNSRVRGGLDLTVALAEAGKTKEMLKLLSSAQRLAKTARMIPGPTGVAADLWLQFQYGWKPLLSDIFGVAEESRRLCVNALQEFEGSYCRKYDNLLISAPNGTSFYGVDQRGLPLKLTGRQACKIRVVLEIPTSSFDVARWGTLNPASLAWELIPFSFVADWFVNVSGYMRNLETALVYNSRFKSGYKSELYAVRQDAGNPRSGRSLVDGYDYTFDFRSSFKRQVYFYRTKLTAYPLPSRPVISADLSWRQILTTSALLHQTMDRRFGGRRS